MCAQLIGIVQHVQLIGYINVHSKLSRRLICLSEEICRDCQNPLSSFVFEFDRFFFFHRLEIIKQIKNII